MRLKISESRNSVSLYVIKSTYVDGKNSSKIVEKLGTVTELEKKLGGEDPIEWAKRYIQELNKKEKEQARTIIVEYSPAKQIPKSEQRTYNGGYLFLQKIYHEIGLHKICRTISEKYKFEFDMDSVMSRLIYGRIIYPSSKLTTYRLSERFIQPPKFDIQHIYRALDFISKESDYIQAELYKNSLKTVKRDSGILYYDCTNYFFEIEQEEGLKQYGFSKEHRPNPIVQMGLFMDGGGVPLAFSISKGNTNEQVTLKPLEEKILTDFKLSRFIVCTDAGLASNDNRKFNDRGNRAFITTQSIKKLKKHVKEWALDPTGWHLPDDGTTYCISMLDENEEGIKYKTFFKERWISENGLEQKLIVTFSLKYRDYQRKIRQSQIERAQKVIDTNPTKIKKANQNDYKRFITKTNCTSSGEIAEKEIYSIDTDSIAQEEIFDGFYGICTNLEDNPKDIIKVNHKRWEIEECFRIMKSEFKARPVFLKRDDRIMAHFTTCFISLMIFRLLEKKLGERFTCHEIIDGLRDMNFHKIHGEGYIPSYTRSDFTDTLHDAFGFRTDYQIVTLAHMKNIFSDLKK